MKASRRALVVISSMVLAAPQEQSQLERVKADHDAGFGCQTWFGILERNPSNFCGSRRERQAHAGILDRDPLALDER